ncbi:MAG: hypothetical protein ACI3ZQ_02105 [Candidatus Cryptobacteroides sp.]
MIALPSIAFGGFSGSAKGVTARFVGGRSILSVRSYPTGGSSNAQVVRRASMSRITKSFKSLSDAQIEEWRKLAESASGRSVFGKRAKLSAINLFVRLNVNRVMAGEGLLFDAPASLDGVPGVSYASLFITPSKVVFSGIAHQGLPYKMVVKMSSPQSAGVSSGWSRTVIISSEVEDDWGEADVTTLYLKTLSVAPVIGQKVFVESYWMDTQTGCAGVVFRDSVIVMSSDEAKQAGLQNRKRVTLEDTVPESSHVSAFNLDFSTGAPVVNHEAVLLGHSNVASSEIVLEEMLDKETLGTSFCVGRGAGEDGNIKPQSYIVYMNNYSNVTKLTYAHRGGDYVKPTEVFGPGIIF